MYTKWTKKEEKWYRLVDDKGNFINALYHHTLEEAKRDRQEENDWHMPPGSEDYVYAIVLVKETTEYADGKFFDKHVEVQIVDKTRRNGNDKAKES